MEECMVAFSHKISDPNGLHARNAAYLAKFGTTCECKVHATCKGSTTDAKHLMGLMKLRAKCGDILDFRVEGKSEAKTAEELKRLAGKLL